MNKDKSQMITKSKRAQRQCNVVQIKDAKPIKSILKKEQDPQDEPQNNFIKIMEDNNAIFNSKTQKQICKNKRIKLRKENKENMENSAQKRHDNSLSILTRRFMKLIKNDMTLTIDLNQASVQLGVQKRRLYDITNVLEGINFVIKTSKNKLQWIGPNGDESNERSLQLQFNKLVYEELILDRIVFDIKEKIKDMKQTEKYYCYLTSEDINRLASLYPLDQKGLIITVPKKSRIQIKEFQQQVNSESMSKSKSNTAFVKKIFINSPSLNAKKQMYNLEPIQDQTPCIQVFSYENLQKIMVKIEVKEEEEEELQERNQQV